MPSLLLRNIRQLIGIREGNPHPLRGAGMAQLPMLEDAWLLVEDGRIADYGPMGSCPERGDMGIDATGRLVLPCWVDSHTHAVFAQTREEEFTDRIRGLSYEQIAARGGGILNSARRLAQTSGQQLFEEALERLHGVMRTGTGAIEVKSGYGLDLENELKMLRVIRRLAQAHPMPVYSTFLGAHALPEAFKHDRDGYIRLLTDEMLPAIASEGLADFVDVFCERNYFSPSEMGRILDAGTRHGLRPKVHVNQFSALGGIGVAVERQALSVDHLEVMAGEDFISLRGSSTIATVLPSCSFFLGIPYAPARQLIDNGTAVCLASDLNPGSSPSGNMPFVLSLACIQLRMLPEEAVNAATANGAHALGIGQAAGAIARGTRADLIITKPMRSIAAIPYSFGDSPVWKVLAQGKEY